MNVYLLERDKGDEGSIWETFRVYDSKEKAEEFKHTLINFTEIRRSYKKGDNRDNELIFLSKFSHEDQILIYNSYPAWEEFYRVTEMQVR